MVRLVQNFVALCVEGELKGDLGLACWDLSCLGHFNVVANQLDGLWLVVDEGQIKGKSHCHPLKIKIKYLVNVIY